MSEPVDLSEQRPHHTITREMHDLSVDAYIALTADAWDAAPLKTRSVRSGVTAECWQIGPCMLSVIDVAPFIFETRRVHLENRGAFVGLKKLVSGFEYGDYEHGETHFSPGQIQIGDPHSTGRGIGTALTIEEIYLPKAMIDLSPDRPMQSEKLHPNSALGKIVHDEWHSIFRLARSGTSKAPKADLERFIASIQIALGAPPQREDVRAHARDLMFRQIDQFISANLRSPNLDIGMILNQFGVSRASLYRMFEPFGGIRTHITQMRASRAVMEIWQTRMMRASVRAAREKWQFRTGSDFNRTIRRVFDNSPRRLLSADRPANTELDVPSEFAFDFVDLRFGGRSAQIAA